MTTLLKSPLGSSPAVVTDYGLHRSRETLDTQRKIVVLANTHVVWVEQHASEEVRVRR